MASAQAIPLFLARTSTGACVARQAPGPGATVQATVTGTGSVAATVVIKVSNISGSWLTLGTLTLSGTTTATAGLALDAHWVYIQADITVLTGTGASVDVVMGSRDDD